MLPEQSTINTNDLPLALLPKNPTSPFARFFLIVRCPPSCRSRRSRPARRAHRRRSRLPDCGLTSGATCFVETNTRTRGGAEAFANCWTFFSILEDVPLVGSIQHFFHRNLRHGDGFRFGEFHDGFQGFVRGPFADFGAVNKNRQEQQQDRVKHHGHEKTQHPVRERQERRRRRIAASRSPAEPKFWRIASFG